MRRQTVEVANSDKAPESGRRPRNNQNRDNNRKPRREEYREAFSGSLMPYPGCRIQVSIGGENDVMFVDQVFHGEHEGKVVAHRKIIRDDGTKHEGYLLRSHQYRVLPENEKQDSRKEIITWRQADKIIDEKMALRRRDGGCLGLRKDCFYGDILEEANLYVSDVVSVQDLPAPEIPYGFSNDVSAA